MYESLVNHNDDDNYIEKGDQLKILMELVETEIEKNLSDK